MIALLAQFLLSASTSFATSCMTSPATTSFFVNEKDNGQVRLQVIHHLGTANAPFFEGIVTGYSLPKMKQKYQMTQKLGDFINIDFSKKECKFTEERMNCFHSRSIKVGELMIKDPYFMTYQEKSQNPFGQFIERKFLFQYRVDGQPYEIRMTYSNSDCS